jgi:mannosyl-3-phosphoglycerate phosphatase
MSSHISEKPRVRDARLLVVTDLDGTLLDFDTYSFEPAKDSLDELRRLRIPIVCCSSKSASEIEYWRRKMRLEDPFISENGAALYLPLSKYRDAEIDGLMRGEYLVKEFGYRREQLRAELTAIRSRTGVPIIGFGDMDTETVRDLCGFSSDMHARLAADREFSEPFVFPPDTPVRKRERVLKEFTKSGVRIIVGKRFYHIVGPNDKGMAVRYLKTLVESVSGCRTLIIAVGDSRNDIELLKAADIPVLVMGKNRRYQKETREATNPILAGAPGPAGFNKAITEILSRQ